ncbi:hypothetical protein ACEQPO_25845 [Bacillus sp. SL00103]
MNKTGDYSEVHPDINNFVVRMPCLFAESALLNRPSQKDWLHHTAAKEKENDTALAAEKHNQRKKQTPLILL